MITLAANHNDIYNRIVHTFLDIEFYDVDSHKHRDSGDFLDTLKPDYLHRELYVRCHAALDDLFYWTNDRIRHDLTALHKLILYRFIEYMIHEKKQNRNFNIEFYDGKSKKRIEKVVRSALMLDDKLSVRKLKSPFYDLRLYRKIFFHNTDFLHLVQRIQQGEILDAKDLNPKEKKQYFDILPLSIQKQISIDAIDIMELMLEFMKFVENNILYGNYAYLFWDKNKAICEADIQVILYNLMEAYFYKRNINITRESLVGRGRIDFTCYINERERLLIEIKKADYPNLIAGFEAQTLQYMKSYRCEKAIYLILCFHDKDMDKAVRFKENHSEFDLRHSHIQIIIWDVRKKNHKLMFRNESKASRNLPYDTDRSFQNLHRVTDVQTAEDAISYLQMLQENHRAMCDPALKMEYHAALIDILSHSDEGRTQFNLLERSLFYCIHDSDPVYRAFLIKMLSIIGYDHLWESKINDLRSIYESLTMQTDIERTTKQEIKDIFEEIKSTKPKVYRYMSKIYMDIYLFEKASTLTDTLSIFSEDHKSCILCRFDPIDAETYLLETNPVYSFFEQIGKLLYLNMTDVYEDIVNVYMEHIFQSAIDPKGTDVQTIFVAGMTLFLMHNTKYEEKEPLGKLLKEKCIPIHNFFQAVFDNLAEETAYDRFLY